MRLNKFIARATGLSRRAADTLASSGEVRINGHPTQLGQEVAATDVVTHRGHRLNLPVLQVIMFNKPAGYVVSRDGQGSPTIYDLLPPELHHLKPVGRLDKDSSGLLLLTNDGTLAEQLTHPKYQKEKVYQVTLNTPLQSIDKHAIEQGIKLEDGLSSLKLSGNGTAWQVKMHEGRNRQIRRTFAARNYTITRLHRTSFGAYSLGQLPHGTYKDTV